MVKTCTACKDPKSTDEFYFWWSAHRGRHFYSPKCRKCIAEAYKEKGAPVRYKAYGLSADQFAAMPKVCGICGRVPKKLVIDHDHKTGRVRGLLCSGCNSALGLFKDSPELMRRAIAYVCKKNV